MWLGAGGALLDFPTPAQGMTFRGKQEEEENGNGEKEGLSDALTLSQRQAIKSLPFLRGVRRAGCSWEC